MNDGNLIGINVANFVSITIMAAAGLFLANLVLKSYKQKTGQQ